jgi:hypothetical protein
MSNPLLATKGTGAGDVVAPDHKPFPTNPRTAYLVPAAVASGHDPNLLVMRVLPDPAVCRANPSGSTAFAACLVERPLLCRHALLYGGGYLCRHPQRDEIILRTARAKPIVPEDNLFG